MFARRSFRLSALFLVLLSAFSVVAVDSAEARRGGSFGSRGTRTFQTAPATPTSPNATPGVQRSMTDSATAARTGTQAGAAARPGMFGGLGGMLLGGLLFSGLFGMLFGAGFGGFGGMLSLLVQVALIGFVVMWFVRRRQQGTAGATPGTSNAGPMPGGMAYETPRENTFGNFGAGASGPASAASRRAGSRDEVGITDADLSFFERRLDELQSAYAREDYETLRRITTPEMMGYLAEELGNNASQGLRNEVFDVKLLQGDVAEAWREGDAAYATVALRYESRDVTRERATGKIVSGVEGLTEATELWTFVRRGSADWIVSAIQETN